MVGIAGAILASCDRGVAIDMANQPDKRRNATGAYHRGFPPHTIDSKAKLERRTRVQFDRLISIRIKKESEDEIVINPPESFYNQETGFHRIANTGVAE